MKQKRESECLRGGTDLGKCVYRGGVPSAHIAPPRRCTMERKFRGIIRVQSTTHNGVPNAGRDGTGGLK